MRQKRAIETDNLADYFFSSVQTEKDKGVVPWPTREDEIVIPSPVVGKDVDQIKWTMVNAYIEPEFDRVNYQ